MAKASAAIASELPPRAHVLDVGGGDGEPLNWLLEQRADIRVTTIDIVPGVGRWIDAAHRERVTCIESTSLEAYVDSGQPMPDVLLLSDVMHHVPVTQRGAFLDVVAGLVARSGKMRVVVKDVEPGHWRAVLGKWSDHYITGDRGVQLISRAELIDSMRRACAGLQHRETTLFAVDAPNYVLVFAL